LEGLEDKDTYSVDTLKDFKWMEALKTEDTLKKTYRFYFNFGNHSGSIPDI